MSDVVNSLAYFEYNHGYFDFLLETFQTEFYIHFNFFLDCGLFVGNNNFLLAQQGSQKLLHPGNVIGEIAGLLVGI